MITAEIPTHQERLTRAGWKRTPDGQWESPLTHRPMSIDAAVMMLSLKPRPQYRPRLYRRP